MYTTSYPCLNSSSCSIMRQAASCLHAKLPDTEIDVSANSK